MRLVAIGLLVLAACGGGGRRAVRPDDMSAARHRDEAAREYAAAADAMERYDPARQRVVGIAGSHEANEPFSYPVAVCNPTESHLRAAEAHSAHAREHEAAAAELERFEEAECGELPPETRAACPVLGDVVAITDVAGGVRVRFADGVPVAAVVAHMRCHLGYARAHGYADAGDCPLYVQGVRIRAAGGQSVDILSDDARRVREIRRRARETAVPAGRTRPTI